MRNKEEGDGEVSFFYLNIKYFLIKDLNQFQVDLISTVKQNFSFTTHVII